MATTEPAGQGDATRPDPATIELAIEEAEALTVWRSSDGWMPGHDREVLRAILQQARNGKNPIMDVQIWHVVQIGYACGQDAVRQHLASILNDAAAVAGHPAGQSEEVGA